MVLTTTKTKKMMLTMVKAMVLTVRVLTRETLRMVMTAMIVVMMMVMMVTTATTTTTTTTTMIMMTLVAAAHGGGGCVVVLGIVPAPASQRLTPCAIHDVLSCMPSGRIMCEAGSCDRRVKP